ncbi:MAG: cobalamin-independent methionine synthase II family protein [Rhodospirillaceae bacterium]|jgi:5-methyltetrahydropteroyltriglutamate--homocysteine methyltransferase|nr:cobalamin-independent methionine synthase II family protein [Rhodospirillaceae bacterium]MBT5047551.1 cobalamin-independent methionine synthase II family protein [Rhodospirillaceae bacterium]MBT5457520.1 cobalamin-independent methionine synthase II family protein [Rhodospirillaceae bacterium]
MKRSTDRILTTHVGSLPRPDELIDVMIAQDKGEDVDKADYDNRLKQAVAGVVQKQVDLGVDIVDDGEFSKRGFAVYAHERLGGLEPTGRARPSPWAESRESHAFPEFYAAEQGAKDKKPTPSSMQMACTSALTYKGQALLDRDLANLRAAADAAGVEEAFVPAISCSDIAGNQLNKHYDSDDDFLYAIADAMNVEYKAIVDAGFLLQIDDPRLINYYVKNPQLSVDECRAWAETQVEAINHSLKGIPEDRVRYHTCYGINMGPRVHDMEMKDFIDIVLKINAGAYSFEAANQRHEHEWRIWEDIKLADGKFIIPGVITHSAVLVEHPELVAERIMRFASVVGRENVMAGGDCGFGTQAMAEPEVHPTIVWAKFQAMADGARIASAKLWS